MKFCSTICIIIVALIGTGCPPPAQRVQPQDMMLKRSDADILVVVHSRTGNTAEMGQTIATNMQADFIRLAVPEDLGDSYMTYPKRNEQVPFAPAEVDLSQYRMIFFGSPVWWYYPTAVIYGFIKNHDLTGKQVVLFYTFEGDLGESAIPEWKELVEGKGAQVVDAIGIDRAKHKDETVETVTEELIAKRKAAWQGKEHY